MGWSAEPSVLVVTGGVLALVVIASLHPRVALRRGSQVVFSIGAAVFVAVGLLAAGREAFDLPWVVLLMPLVPLAVIVMMVRSALGAPAEAPRAPTATIAPEREEAPFGASGPSGARLLAASPYATPSELTQLAYSRPDLRPAIASNPSAPSSLLQWLVDQGEPAVLAAVAARRIAPA